MVPAELPFLCDGGVIRANKMSGILTLRVVTAFRTYTGYQLIQIVILSRLNPPIGSFWFLSIVERKD
jgi:hypothetical protein